MNKLPEDITESFVRHLCLTIGLRVIWRREAELGAINLMEPSPKPAGKARVSVRDDALRKAVISDDTVKDDVGNLTRTDAIAARNETCALREAINDDEDSIMATGSGRKKGANKVHGDGLPTALRDRKGLKKAIR
jgi:hypothetical protein